MKTGLLYDEIFLKHNLPGHPEHAGRLKAIVSYLEDHPGKSEQGSLFAEPEKVTARPATETELLTCHDKELISQLRESGKNGLSYIDPDTYMNEFSYEAAIRAAGGMIDLAGKVADNELTNGIVLARPPGHHATVNRAMGFCLFNTIALGVRSCILHHGIEKAAIVDIDVHHGNGTQWIFYSDPSVLYISTHQYPHYPGSGKMNETGEGEGRGTTINIPFPAYTGDKGYQKALEEVIVPSLKRFRPGFLFVSVGFDAHGEDPLSAIQLSLTGYNVLCRALINTAEELCRGRIIFCLEGGYNLNVLGPGIGNIVQGLLGNKVYDDPFPAYEERPGKVDELIRRIRDIHGL
ncbi:MAG: histone deacetylase [Spirochaetales bacterium]|nr:histone deacetylase [Spirochaetales bacterium]